MLRLRFLQRIVLRVSQRLQSSDVASFKKPDKEVASTTSAKTAETLPLPGGPLTEFFDKEDNFGVNELRPKYRPGRSWTVEELRLKSNSDLHKLWYVLLKERNMLLTMEHAYNVRNRGLPNPERKDRVNESMENIEHVVHERNDAYLKLETGEGASPPERTVTSFAGFTYKKQTTEHLLPHEVTEDIEYEEPYLSESAYVMQKLWAEKQHLKAFHKADEERYKNRLKNENFTKYARGDRKTFNCVEQLPK
uniref:Large ribosomal subunit protein uL29m n=2 Tax=Panagrolaimus sp. JU765 TaxID=591449 RepID=A0AC34R5W1_9BILA